MINKLSKRKGWIQFLKNLYLSFLENEMSALSAQLSYSVLFSFFPFLIFLFTLISYISIINIDIIQGYSYLMPTVVYDIFMEIIAKTSPSKVQTTLYLSMIIALWAASGGILAIMRGMNKAYKIVEHRSFWKVRLLSLVFTIALAILLVMLLITLVLGEAIGSYLFKDSDIYLKSIWDAFRHILPVFSAFIIFVSVYKYMPNCKVTFKAALPGSIFSSISWFILSLGFSYYVNNFISYSRIYGSIGGVIALLVWLYWSSMIILLGGTINSLLSPPTKRTEPS